MYPYHRFIQSYTHNGRIGVLLELGLETWLVTGRPEFMELSRGLAMHIAAQNPESVEALLRELYVKDGTRTVRDVLAEGSNLLGEKITVMRFVRWQNETLPPRLEPTPPDDPAVAIRPRRA